MSTASLAKKDSAYWLALSDQYQKEHPGAFSVEAFGEWSLSKGHADLPRVNPRSAFYKQIKKALREVRLRDPDGAIVRGMLPAKVPIVDANGNMVFDVQWDHIHRMSADHALLAFDQRDQNIVRQKRSASRDLKSFLKFNPNGKGMGQTFMFGFMDEDEPAPPEPQRIPRPKKNK